MSDIVFTADGHLEFFDPKPFIDAANILVAADEPLRALQLLDNVPAYYRDHKPLALQAVRDDIMSLLATPTFYQEEDVAELPVFENIKHVITGLYRYNAVKKDVQAMNDAGIVPHVMDLGPGEYWLPVSLDAEGLKFTYLDIGLNKGSRKLIKEKLDTRYVEKPPADRPTIYVACEIIEHLHYEQDIVTECYRYRVKPNIIHISTPKYTFDTRQERINWTNYGALGHLRTYTPREFTTNVIKMFPGYRFQFYDDKIMHLRGERIDG